MGEEGQEAARGAGRCPRAGDTDMGAGVVLQEGPFTGPWVPGSVFLPPSSISDAHLAREAMFLFLEEPVRGAQRDRPCPVSSPEQSGCHQQRNS